MNEPPDVAKQKYSFTTGLNYDFSKKLSFTTNGPVYLTITRTENEKNLTNVSPFLIKRVIDATCNGEVSECKKLRNGTLLVKCKNTIQASKLIRLTSMSFEIKINVAEHKTLNFSKGVIYSSDLFGVPEEEILTNMACHKITEVKKIYKKQDESLKETGLLILTFSSVDLPEFVYMGYQKIYIRPYIPLPLRCNKCLRYGHVQNSCECDKICFNCGKIEHVNPDTDEKCVYEICCINCKENNLDNYKHTAKDKSCPIFLKNKEIQAIRVLEKTSISNAERIYNKRQLNKNHSFASIAGTNATTNSRPKLINYDDPILKECQNAVKASTSKSTVSKLNNDNGEKTKNSSQSKSIIIEHIDQSTTTALKSKCAAKILPRNASNRLKTQLKAKFKTNSKTNPTNKSNENLNNAIGISDDDEIMRE